MFEDGVHPVKDVRHVYSVSYCDYEKSILYQINKTHYWILLVYLLLGYREFNASINMSRHETNDIYAIKHAMLSEIFNVLVNQGCMTCKYSIYPN